MHSQLVSKLLLMVLSGDCTLTTHNQIVQMFQMLGMHCQSQACMQAVTVLPPMEPRKACRQAVTGPTSPRG